MELSKEKIKKIWNALNLSEEDYDYEEFSVGIKVELEHGKKAGDWNVTDDNLKDTAKITLAHLDEIPDYYTRLKKMENSVNECRKIDNVVGILSKIVERIGAD